MPHKFRIDRAQMAATRPQRGLGGDGHASRAEELLLTAKPFGHFGRINGQPFAAAQQHDNLGKIVAGGAYKQQVQAVQHATADDMAERNLAFPPPLLVNELQAAFALDDVEGRAVDQTTVDLKVGKP